MQPFPLSGSSTLQITHVFGKIVPQYFLFPQSIGSLFEEIPYKRLGYSNP